MDPALGTRGKAMLHVIELEYDAALGTLSLVDAGDAALSITRSTDRVQWLVGGCPNDCYPRIRFLTGEGDVAMGPFNGLRQSPSYLISDGLLGKAGMVYPYEISLVQSGTSAEQPSTVAATLGGLTLVKAAEGESTGLKLVVTPQGDDGLRVEPEEATIYTGDSVRWVFEGLEDEPSWLPRVEFYRAPEGSRQLNRHFGPFTSLSTQEAEVVGSGNNGVLGEFDYVVQTIDAATGEPFRSKIKDPGMGNDGDPPGGAGP